MKMDDFGGVLTHHLRKHPIRFFPKNPSSKDVQLSEKAEAMEGRFPEAENLRYHPTGNLDFVEGQPFLMYPPGN